ncbi:MAG TPA: hypothetical protein PKA38_02330 [Candidatus Levybacteria bacterium]|nr:hypothetical protein [Candidatus Levybacteria bacterium]
MAERIRKNEIQENWSGHSFKDSCQWSSEPKPQYTPDVIWRAMVKHANRDSMGMIEAPYFNRMLAAQLNRSENPIRTLSEGQTFNVGDFTIGTILKVTGLTQGKFRSYHLNDWGMLTEEQDLDGIWKDAIVTFSERELESGRVPSYGGGRFLHKNFTVGEVIHDKRRDTLPWTQYLTRYDSVEIWKYGRGLRSRVTNPMGVASLQSANSLR